MKNYLFAAAGIAATISAIGLSTLVIVPCVTILVLAGLYEYRRLNFEKDFNKIDKSRVDIIDKQMSRIRELGDINDNLNSELSLLKGQYIALESTTIKQEAHIEAVKKVSKPRKTTKTK